MIRNNTLHSTATEVSLCIQIWEGRTRPSESGPFICSKFREFAAWWKDTLGKHIDVFSGGSQDQLTGDYKGALPWLMNKSRKWSEKKRESKMFRQMAHLKCLRQGISNFNETLDPVYELFLISPKRREEKQLQGRQEFSAALKGLLRASWDRGEPPTQVCKSEWDHKFAENPSQHHQLSKWI